MSEQEDANNMLLGMAGRLAEHREPVSEGLIFRSKAELDRYVAERVRFELDEIARELREHPALQPSSLLEEETNG